MINLKFRDQTQKFIYLFINWHMLSVSFDEVRTKRKSVINVEEIHLGYQKLYK